MHDTLIHGALLVDGSGEPARAADIYLHQGRISAICPPSAPRQAARHSLDAQGCIITPGFIDVHTHYDGQVTWAKELLPSSRHGVSTVVMGNCGVGFAPCRAEHRALLMQLMEGVEDIPQPVLAAGLPWCWQSFEEYLDFLQSRRYDIDICAYLPHAALRVFVMGERAARREAATAADIAHMGTLLRSALAAGAVGFSTSRTLFHRASDGSLGPSYGAAENELLALADAMRDAGRGVWQMITDLDDLEQSFALIKKIASRSGRPVTFSLLEGEHGPLTLRWRELLSWIEAAEGEGLCIRPQVLGRAIGVMLGHELTLSPFYNCPSYHQLQGLPFDEKIAVLRTPAMRTQMLSEMLAPDPAQALSRLARDFEHMFELGEPPEYEPDPEQSIAARARRLQISAETLAYDILLAQDGRNMLYTTLSNYVDGNLDSSRSMMLSPFTILGLGDGGAHCATICDAAWPSFMLSHWVQGRTRGPRLALEWVIKAMSLEPAQLLGLHDRGLLSCGYKADLNIINLSQLRLQAPRICYDLPDQGKRLLQSANGYRASFVNGDMIYKDGVASGALPGKLLRLHALSA